MSWREVGLRRTLTDWLRDPLRRRNVALRVLETLLPAVLLFWALVPWWAALGLAGLLTALEFALYEFILEPYLHAGPYWERGPRDGETFTRW